MHTCMRSFAQYSVHLGEGLEGQFERSNQRCALVAESLSDLI